MERAVEDQWRRRQAGTLPSLETLQGCVATETARRVVSTYRRLIAEGGDALPRKRSFDPSVLGRDLANTILYEVSDPTRVVFRIVGETMKEHFRINPVGRSYLEFVPERRRPHALAAFRACAETPCAMLSRTRRVFASGVSRYCEAVGLPLMAETPNGPASHLLFVDVPVALHTMTEHDTTEFQFAHLLERRFIDVGRGVPDAFDDLVLVDPSSPFHHQGV